MYLMFGSFKYSLSQPNARIYTHWPMQCENTVSKKCEYGVLEKEDFYITRDFQNPILTYPQLILSLTLV